MSKKAESHFPNTVIIGAPKSGTSSLFFWLTAHPEVCGSKEKETYFLADTVSRHNTGLNYIENGLDAYARHFQHWKGEKIKIEASAPYIYMDTPIEVLSSFEEKPTIIAILRKPADRLYSHYVFNRYRMKNIDMSFEDYLKPENKPNGWGDYLDHTDYAKWLKRWVNAFGKEKVKVYLMEDMVKDKAVFMKKVSTDLDIDPTFYDEFDFFHRNKTVAVKRKWLHRFGLKVEPFVPQWLQERIIPLYLKTNASKIPPISQKDKELKMEINKAWISKNQALEDLFPELDLSDWKL